MHTAKRTQAGALVGALASALCLSVPAFAAPAKKAAPPAKKPRVTVAARPVAGIPGAVRLTLAPAEFTLDGSRSNLHFVATAYFKDGTERDVTDRVRFSLANAGVATIRDGVATGARDGETRVTASLGALSSQPVALKVRNSGAPAPTQFVNDIMPILAKTGCNSTACHGSPAGKGGLKLSLFGYEPALDHIALAKDADGKRVDTKDPAKSLLLQKATMSIPHAGGKRVAIGSRDYEVLLAWLKEGAPGLGEFEPRVKQVQIVPAQPWIPAPGLKQRLLVLASMSDGSVQDVTERALFTSDDDSVAEVDAAGRVTARRSGESAVMVRYLGQVAVSQVAVLPSWQTPTYPKLAGDSRIDELVYAKLKKLRVAPSELSTDEQFIRRATLDVCGIIPAPEEVRAFLADTAPDKRARLVDSLLARPEFIDMWTMKWNDTLRNSPRVLKYSSVEYGEWIHEQVAANRPYDQFARDLITATGSPVRPVADAAVASAAMSKKARKLQAAGQAASPQLTKQQQKKQRLAGDPEEAPFNPATNFFVLSRDPLDVASATSQLFMGARIECARCHNHPFEKWTQRDYYGFAAFFAGIGNPGKAKKGGPILVSRRPNPLRDPRTNEPVAPTALDNVETPMPATGDARTALATWLTSPQNPFFARAIVNRVWGHYLGRGIVEPVDDFRVTNPASNPELLDALAKHLVDNKYDLKAVHRLILNSRTYQQSSRPNEQNAGDTRNFARYYPKRLMAEQLYDSISQATGVFLNEDGGAVGRKNGKAGKARPAARMRRMAGGGPERVMQLPALGVSRKGQASGPAEFLDTFGKPRRESVCECERSSDGNMGQALALLNGDEVNEKLTSEAGRVRELLASGKSDAEMVEELYLAMLSRKPTPRQLSDAVILIRTAPAKDQGVEDLAWSLLNSREFLFNH